MHYTYWKSVKNFDSFRRMVERSCPSDPSTLTFAFSRLSQFYRSNSHNNNYYNIFKSLESRVLTVPVEGWITRELSSVALSLSFFKHWIDHKTISHMFKSFENSICNLNALDISHIMCFIGNLRNNHDIGINVELNNLLKNISKHLRRRGILRKNLATAKNIICILSSYAKLDITDSQLLSTCCKEVNCRLNELAQPYEVANALNAISRMLSKHTSVDKIVETVICELITRFTELEHVDSESFADFLDSISRLISHGKLDCIDQLLRIFTQTINKRNELINCDEPKVLRVILRSLRNINFKHETFIEHCLKNCENDHESWSFGALCDLISTIGQSDTHKGFINSRINRVIFNKLAIQMSRRKYIPHPDTLINLAIICHYDYKLLCYAEKLIVYLLVTSVQSKIPISTVDKLNVSATILLQTRPQIISKLDISTLKMLCDMAKMDNIIGFQNVNLQPMLSEIEGRLEQKFKHLIVQ